MERNISKKANAKANKPTPSVKLSRDLPAPFASVESRFKPFVDILDTSKVYIVHLDTLPWKFKRKLFSVPVLLNLAIAILLGWRAYTISPAYLDLLLYVVGYNNAATVDVKSKTWAQLAWITLRRALMLMLDFVLLKVILPWPLTFFFEAPANPVSWRWNVGFRDTEVVVRESRGWGAEDLKQGLAKGEENPFFKVRIRPAIDKGYMEGKTGYLMMNKDWDLDFAAMIRAHELIKSEALKVDEFKKSVLVHGEASGWLVWKVHELDEGGSEEARQKVLGFKEKLTAMGKEDLFYRWIEMMQYETSQADGFTQERQMAAAQKAKALFAEHGVDMEEFMTSIGGEDGLINVAPSVGQTQE